MKVALVCDWFHPRIGGIELHLHDLATRLTAVGHECVVITPTPGPSIVDGIRVVRVEARRAPYYGFLMTRGGVRAIGRALDDERADVAHCHVSIVAPAGFGGAYEAQRRRIPTVVTFHSFVPQTPLIAKLARLLFHMDAWPAVFSAVSSRVAREIASLTPTPVRVLPNGIDASFWCAARQVRHPRTDVLELISVMRLNAKKRPLALVKSMRRLRTLLPNDRRFRLRIVGDGPQRAQVARLVARTGLGDRIEILGLRTRAEIRDLLAESHAFVLPTVRESFGLAALEALCAGLPVVAMRRSAVAELVEHGRDGLLADSDDELADHIASLDQHFERFGGNGSPSPSLAAFSWPAALDTHLGLYREAIALRDSVCAEKTR